MRVSCNSCQATYEFDAATIPANGYDARCTNCGAVFFVAPEQEAPAPPPPPETVSVSCAECGAVYQFSPSDIPEGGYDARCTHCQAVFFVSVDGGGAPASPPAAPEPVAPIPEPAPVVPPPDPEPSPASVSSPHTATAAEGPPATFNYDFGDEDPNRSAHDMVEMSDELGEPAASPPGASMRGDFEQIMARKRRVRMIIGGGAGALLVVMLLWRFALPGLWDASIGPVIGIKARIAPEAIPLMEEGMALLLEDTEDAYRQAIAKFDAALGIDPQFPRAIAGKGLAHTFLGKDIQERGRARKEEAQAIAHKIQLLNDAKGEDRPEDAEQQVETMRAEALGIDKAATKVLEESGQHLNQAAKLLRAAFEDHKRSAILSTALGIYFISADPEITERAEQRLDRAVRLYDLETLDLNKPPDPWLPFLSGAIHLARRGGEKKAIESFAAAVKAEPKLRRARVEMAIAEFQSKNNGEARRLAEQILKETADHARARGVLAKLDKQEQADAAKAAAEAEASAQAAADDQEAGKGKAKTKGKAKAKGKAKRKKRRL